ncbi:hypothetical protein NDU88_004637 [Pleurodeles waltl]|uniref:Uncharacterized protein n=1 Tax=Pleurodeles waltl TaxID=8319 RepID=A0AAV7MW06_PLEWA|nr:hypothetical protein NDU88_004637 [Pleurodeles waltl]
MCPEALAKCCSQEKAWAGCSSLCVRAPPLGAPCPLKQAGNPARLVPIWSKPCWDCLSPHPGPGSTLWAAQAAETPGPAITGPIPEACRQPVLPQSYSEDSLDLAESYKARPI